MGLKSLTLLSFGNPVLKAGVNIIIHGIRFTSH